MLACRYIDHYSCDKKDLGIFYKDVPTFEGSMLTTCHRVEVINVVDGPIPNFELKGYHSKQILGTKNVAMRLANIAAGVDSIILGESFVFDQVKNAFKHVTDPLIFQTVQNSLKIAKIARETHNFYSNCDYSGIAICLLGELKDVVIIGSGMLAKSLYYKLNGNATIVTRNLKSARDFNDVVKINNLPDGEFKCIIATTSSKKYKRRVNRHLNDSKCSMAVDLSAIPFLTDAKFKYITMYDDIFEQKIEKSNMSLFNKINLVKKTITEKVNDIWV